ncbi:DUF2946 family protein [Methylosinus sp. LW4]|uniref:DUF2946 family protein n=1 Tax=Methylosinus sp. LW4 TaxID=136993 RepID=UPI0012FB6018|nr:DUF2946 family protein [Methylosinus sp. LW4]
MAKKWRASTFAVRLLGAFVALALLVSQGLELPASARSADLTEGVAALSVASAEFCERSGKRHSRDDRHDASQCCVYCAGDGRAQSAALLATPFFVSAFLAAVIGRRPQADRSLPATTGWLASWSSRSPPDDFS